MKWLPALVVSLSLALLACAVVLTPLVWLPTVVLSAIGSGGLAAGWAVHVVRRDRAVRKLVVAAYQAGHPDAMVPTVLVRLLGTPDVLDARTAYLRAYDERQYAAMRERGECSDR